MDADGLLNKFAGVGFYLRLFPRKPLSKKCPLSAPEPSLSCTARKTSTLFSMNDDWELVAGQSVIINLPTDILSLRHTPFAEGCEHTHKKCANLFIQLVYTSKLSVLQ